jgi:DNA-directed RNA polymerase specialized sigma24 family protein
MAKALVERLFLEHHTQLTRALTRAFGCESRACDAAQDTYLRLLRYRAAPVGNPKAYLFRCAVNALSDQVARERRPEISQHRWTLSRVGFRPPTRRPTRPSATASACVSCPKPSTRFRRAAGKSS